MLVMFSQLKVTNHIPETGCRMFLTATRDGIRLYTNPEYSCMGPRPSRLTCFVTPTDVPALMYILDHSYSGTTVTTKDMGIYKRIFLPSCSVTAPVSVLYLFEKFSARIIFLTFSVCLNMSFELPFELL